MRLLFIPILALSLTLVTSCRDECDSVSCENGGVCVSGDCECPEYYEGERCQVYNPEGIKNTTDGEEGGCSGHGDDNDNPYKD